MSSTGTMSSSHTQTWVSSSRLGCGTFVATQKMAAISAGTMNHPNGPRTTTSISSRNPMLAHSTASFRPRISSATASRPNVDGPRYPAIPMKMANSQGGSPASVPPPALRYSRIDRTFWNSTVATSAWPPSCATVATNCVTTYSGTASSQARNAAVRASRAPVIRGRYRPTPRNAIGPQASVRCRPRSAAQCTARHAGCAARFAAGTSGGPPVRANATVAAPSWSGVTCNRGTANRPAPVRYSRRPTSHALSYPYRATAARTRALWYPCGYAKDRAGPPSSSASRAVLSRISLSSKASGSTSSGWCTRLWLPISTPAPATSRIWSQDSSGPSAIRVPTCPGLTYSVAVAPTSRSTSSPSRKSTYPSSNVTATVWVPLRRNASVNPTSAYPAAASASSCSRSRRGGTARPRSRPSTVDTEWYMRTGSGTLPLPLLGAGDEVVQRLGTGPVGLRAVHPRLRGRHGTQRHARVTVGQRGDGRLVGVARPAAGQPVRERCEEALDGTGEHHDAGVGRGPATDLERVGMGTVALQHPRHGAAEGDEQEAGGHGTDAGALGRDGRGLRVGRPCGQRGVQRGRRRVGTARRRLDRPGGRCDVVRAPHQRHHSPPGCGRRTGYPAPAGRGSGDRVPAVLREVAEQPLVAVARGDRLDEQVAADESALPRGAPTAERLLPVAPRARLVDADLERVQLLGELDGERVAEPDRLDHRQVHVEELVDQVTLHHEARVRGAPLLAVLEALADVPGQQVPLGELPDAPRVEPLLLDHVALVGVEQRGGDLATVGPAADEGHRADLGCPDQYLGKLLAGAGHQGHRQAGAAHQRVRDGQADRA